MRKLSFLLSLILLVTACAYAETIPATDPGWYPDMWYTDPEVSSLKREGDDLCVNNSTENDARFCITLDVEPDTIYRISCEVLAEGIGTDAIGANLSILNTFTYSESVYDTKGAWRELTLLGQTGEDQTGLILCARVGGYSNLNTGTARFRAFAYEAVDPALVPADAQVLSLAPLKSEEEDTDETGEPARNTPAWLLLAFGILLALTAAVRRCRKWDSLRPERAAFLWILAAALVIRIVIAARVRGYWTDINCFTAWSERIFTKGLTGHYSPDYFCDYPPVYMALLWFAAALRRLIGAEVCSTAHIVLIKSIPILCDLGTACLIRSFAKKRAGNGIALLLGGICALNPALIIDSAGWGQIDSVFTLLLILSAVLLTEDRAWLALPVCTLAILTKPQALLFAPLGLTAALCYAIRARERDAALRRFFAGLTASLILLFLTALLFHDRSMGALKWLLELYTNTVSGYQRLTVNAFGLWTLLGKNWAELGEFPVLTVIAWVLFACSLILSVIACIRTRRRRSLFLIAASMLMCMCAFGPMIHERYVYPAAALLLLAFASDQDRRILFSLGILSVTLWMNQVLVLQGGMTEANFGHLQESEQWLNVIMSLLTCLNALFTAYITFRITLYGESIPLSSDDPSSEADLPETVHTGRRSAGDAGLHLKRPDLLALVLVTAAYSVLTFTDLGTFDAPQAGVVFEEGDTVTFDLGEVGDFRMLYYGGICDEGFTVSLSENGIRWTEPVPAMYDQGQIFRWLIFFPADESGNRLTSDRIPEGVRQATGSDQYPYQHTRFFRIAGENGLDLFEVGFRKPDGTQAEATVCASTIPEADLLLDEQTTIPELPSYYNSTYFDEIYHARTAYEHLHGMNAYEWTHPPMGKLLMMLGIRLFGMCPFGWRFMGALAGVLMLPLIYLTVKQLGLSHGAAATAMLLLALDSMHFTQTRIATIDSYAVLFIMLMYLFMIRYLRFSACGAALKKALVPLALCGISMGFAWATKWIGLYASVGLAILFFVSLGKRLFAYRAERKKPESERDSAVMRFPREAWITIGFCILFFVAVPVLIYFFSYRRQMLPQGGLTLRRVWDTQISMYNYHAGLGGDTHFFRSPWYEWPVIAWPMWYYSGTGYLREGLISSISCMGNPAVWWSGLAALLFLMWRCAWRRRADRKDLTILTGFASQYLPWILVPRSTFIYHYFASVPFLILALARSGELITQRDKKAGRILCAVLVLLALVLFIAFYPLESGHITTRAYARLLKWFKWYNY